MAWEVLDRRQPVIDPQAPPLLSEAVRAKIRSFLPRYETKRAALLPALHVVQDALGHVNPQAMVEIAQILELPPSNVMDVASFYTHFFTHPKGEKTIIVCRSLSCELCGGRTLLDALKSHLGIEEHETTSDGRYTLVTEECLAACDHAPCMMIDERMHRNVSVEDLPRILDDPDNNKLSMPRSDLFDSPQERKGAS